MPTEKGTHHAVVLVSSCAGDHASLRKIFGNSPWELHGASTGSDFLGMLSSRNYYDILAVICEPNLPDGDWKSLLKEMNRIPAPPSLIVTSRVADQRLWAEVLNLGAYDLLLATPFEAEEVLRVIGGACRACISARERAASPRISPGLTRGPLDVGPKAILAGSAV
jgi:DNA-binding response OmpR family regulator